jgi:hypothetical protein
VIDRVARERDDGALTPTIAHEPVAHAFCRAQRFAVRHAAQTFPAALDEEITIGRVGSCTAEQIAETRRRRFELQRRFEIPNVPLAP